MKPEIKKLWVDALRSGEYKQAKHKLRTTKGSFCCLGVLCNLHAQAHPEIATEQKKATVYMGESQFLPLEVVNWAKLPSYGGARVTINSTKMQLTAHNDDGRTFLEIADAIEEQL